MLFVSLLLREGFAQVSALLFSRLAALEKVPLEVGLGVITLQLLLFALRLAHRAPRDRDGHSCRSEAVV